VARLLLVLTVAAVVLAGAADADNPTLTGTVGTDDSFQLVLTDPAGKPISHVDPGTYTLVVHDRSTLHNFHLFGPGGVDAATTVETTGDATFTVSLVDGVYTFQCDPHSFSGMRGRFAVGTASLAQPATKVSASIVGSKATLGPLSPGKAVITVRDRSKTDGFVLQGPGVAKRTGIGFTGTVTWTVTLRTGTYVWGSAAHIVTRHRISLKS
jgi:plastocyanin